MCLYIKYKYLYIKLAKIQTYRLKILHVGRCFLPLIGANNNNNNHGSTALHGLGPPLSEVTWCCAFVAVSYHLGVFSLLIRYDLLDKVIQEAGYWDIYLHLFTWYSVWATSRMTEIQRLDFWPEQEIDFFFVA
jgi:hypothetical protein